MVKYEYGKVRYGYDENFGVKTVNDEIPYFLAQLPQQIR